MATTFETTFVEKYDRWIIREAWNFVKAHKGAGDVDDYIQTAREAALRICKRKGYTADNLTALIMGDIRIDMFNAMYTAYSKRDGIGLNAHTLRDRPVIMGRSHLVKHCEVSPIEDEDNSLLWSMQSAVNEEWKQILQEIASGYTLVDVSGKHNMSPQLLHYNLRMLGEYVENRKGKLPKCMRKVS